MSEGEGGVRFGSNRPSMAHTDDDPDPRAFPGFERFREDPDAPFFASRMPGFGTPEATWAEAHRSLTVVVMDIMREATRRPLRMGRDDLMRWHRATFRTTFPHQAGRLRDEPVAFQIRWREGGELHKRACNGTEVSRILHELDAAFAAYNAEREARGSERRPLREAVTAAAALYIELLRIHPFEDGNLRAALPALEGALISLGAAAVDFESAVAEHDEALGWALHPDGEKRSLEPFVELVLERLKGLPVNASLRRMEES